MKAIIKNLLILHDGVLFNYNRYNILRIINFITSHGAIPFHHKLINKNQNRRSFLCEANICDRNHILFDYKFLKTFRSYVMNKFSLDLR